MFDYGNLAVYHYSSNNPVRYVDPTGMFDWDNWTVEGGDTLASIVDEANLVAGTDYSWQYIAEFNDLVNPHVIREGDHLYFPNDVFDAVHPEKSMCVAETSTRNDSIATKFNSAFRESVFGEIQNINRDLDSIASGAKLFGAGFVMAGGMYYAGYTGAIAGAARPEGMMLGFVTSAVLMADGMHQIVSGISGNPSASVSSSIIRSLISPQWQSVGEGFKSIIRSETR